MRACGTTLNIQQVAYAPNAYDQCLVKNRIFWDELQRLGGLSEICPERSDLFGSPPWVDMPSNGRRFQRVGSVVLPADDGTDNLVLQVPMPVGYDGVLITVTCMFTGAGFVEASGDLTWRLRCNGYCLRDLGIIQTQLGTLSEPYALEGGGYKLQSGQTLRFYVAVALGAAVRLDPFGRVICGLTGWVYPRQ